MKQCDKVEEDGGRKDEYSVLYGINRRSILTELKYFDICNGGLLPDVMHDVLEGALVYEAKLIMQHCIDKQYLSFTTLSRTLESMELGYMEVGNRPSHFTLDVLRSTNKTALGQNGKSLYMPSPTECMCICPPCNISYYMNILFGLASLHILYT